MVSQQFEHKLLLDQCIRNSHNWQAFENKAHLKIFS